VCWEYREDRAGRARPAQRPGRAAFRAQPVVAFLPLASSGCCSARRSRPICSSRAVVATAFIVGGLRHSLGRTPRASHPRRVGRRPVAARRAQARLGAGAGADSRHLALGATIIGGLLFGLSRGGDRVFLLPGHADADRRDDLPALQGARAAFLRRYLGMWVVGFVAAFISAFSACAGCCVSSARTISRSSPGIASPFGIVVLVTWHSI
jgi:undecaprenyl-diphosphatase